MNSSKCVSCGERLTRSLAIGIASEGLSVREPGGPC